MIGLYIGLSCVALLLILLAVVIIRTLNFTAKEIKSDTSSTVNVDGEKAVNDLAEMIKCVTVSDKNKENEVEAEFEKFKELLKKCFPNIYAKCELTELGNRALLYKYAGESSDAPSVFMAHYDVVSVEEDMWSVPPFDGVMKDGVLWGRGALDTKVTLNGAMQALEALIAEGFVPKSDIYLAFAGDEEINGTGASMIVDLFEEKGIKPSMVLDEGGAVVDDIFPGVTKPCAMVGIAEKGMLNLEFSYSGNGGHSSYPKPHTPVGRLSDACVKIENHPFKFTVSGATKKMFNVVARHSTFVYRMIFANLWLFAPVLNIICKKQGGELNALLRTTCAFTQMEGSKGVNVIPPSAKMVANLRLIPGDTVDGAVKYIEKVIDNPDIKINIINGNNPSVISDINCEGWNRVTDAIHATWGDIIVSPYLMFACSDSRHWGRISDKVYRFSTMKLSNEERATIHGNDERIPFETVIKSVEFYTRIMKNS